MASKTALLLPLLLAPVLSAQVRLAAPFGDHMVLQRDAPIRVSGHAAAGETVRVTLAGASAEAQAGPGGAWAVELPAQQAGGPHQLVVAGAKSTVRLEDVLIGELWICSGQSNMDWTVRNSADPEATIAGADHPRIRLLKVKRTTATEPQDTFEGSWTACTPEAITNFSAVGYHFGRALQGALDVPVGLIHTAWGGTRAEAWTRPEALAKGEMTRPIVERWDEIVAAYPAAMEKHEAAIQQWQEAASKARADGKQPPRRPGAPTGPNSQHAPGRLFFGMISPLLPLRVGGAIWYQGESNAGRAVQYRELFPMMIEDWRDAFGQPDMPFLFVQLANFENRNPWAELREAQLRTLSLPHTGMAVIIDVGNPRDIHPRDKKTVGERLARLARAQVFGEEIVPCGPIYRSLVREDGGLRLRFDHVGGGLVARGELAGFEVAGADRKYHAATARIDGDTVFVESDAVAEPIAVRYAWASNPQATLFNAEGLPATPFASDDWERVSQDARRP